MPYTPIARIAALSLGSCALVATVGLVVLALLYGLPEPFIRIGPFWISADLSTFFSVFS